jgi:phosphate transport system substrate-binding protein
VNRRIGRSAGHLARLGVLAGLILAVVAPSQAALAGGKASPNDTVFPSAVLGSGSDVLFHVSSALDLLYNESPGCTTIAPSGTQPLDLECIPQSGDITTEDYAHDRISEAAPIGGGAGITQLCEQTLPNVANIDYARQTSGPGNGVCTGLHYVAFARDGVTWEAFPGVKNSATAHMNNQAGACSGSSGFCLTQQQLQGIYVNCTITNWNQVGGTNHAIVLYTIKPQFGTRKAWDTFLGGSSSSCPGVKLVDQTDNSEITKADKPYAIVPVSAGSWRERYSKKTGGSALGLIDGVAPSIPNEQNGSFPFSRFLYNVFCNSATCGTASQASAATQKYVFENGWICTADAHAKDPVTGIDYRTEIANTITKYGFAPLPIGATGGGSAFVNYCRLFTT